MKNVVIVTAKNFEDEEFSYPYYRLLEEGFHVDIAVHGDERVKGKHGLNATPTVKISKLNYKNYDCVIIPGGVEAPDTMRVNKKITRFVKDMYENGKIVAAICHGPWVLISSGIMKGKKGVSYISIKDDMENAGVNFIEAPVVVDKNIITAPHYKHNVDFMREIINLLK